MQLLRAVVSNRISCSYQESNPQKWSYFKKIGILSCEYTPLGVLIIEDNSLSFSLFLFLSTSHFLSFCLLSFFVLSFCLSHPFHLSVSLSLCLLCHSPCIFVSVCLSVYTVPFSRHIKTNKITFLFHLRTDSTSLEVWPFYLVNICLSRTNRDINLYLHIPNFLFTP